jgi:hypothetical protein
MKTKFVHQTEQPPSQNCLPWYLFKPRKFTDIPSQPKTTRIDPKLGLQ